MRSFAVTKPATPRSNACATAGAANVGYCRGKALPLAHSPEKRKGKPGRTAQGDNAVQQRRRRRVTPRNAHAEDGLAAQPRRDLLSGKRSNQAQHAAANDVGTGHQNVSALDELQRLPGER